MPAAGIAEWVNSTQALVTGVTVLIGGCLAVFRFARKGFMAVAGVGDRIEAISNKLDKVVAEVTPNGGGSMKDAVGNLVDGQMSMTKAVKRIEATQTATMQLTDKAFWRSNPDGFCTFASPRLCKLVGVDASAILEMAWVSLVKQSDRASVKIEWDNAVKDQRPFEMPYSYFVNGKEIPIIGRAFPVFDIDHELVGMIGWAELEN